MSPWPVTRTLLPHSDGTVSSSMTAGHILMMSVMHVTPLRSSLAVLAEVSAGGGTWLLVLVKIRSGNTNFCPQWVAHERCHRYLSAPDDVHDHGI